MSCITNLESISIYRSQWPRGVRYAIPLKQYYHTYFEYLSFLGQSISLYTHPLRVCQSACLILFRGGGPYDGPIPRPGVLQNFYKKRFRNAEHSPWTAKSYSAIDIGKQRDATFVQQTATEKCVSAVFRRVRKISKSDY